MSDTAHRVACDEGGDPPCWSHLVEQAEFDASRPDLADRAGIERMVRDFYRDAAMDDVLGPVFHAARVDWSAHIATLVDFWSWQLLGDPGYAGHPLRAHEPVHARTPLTSVHYERWCRCSTRRSTPRSKVHARTQPSSGAARWPLRWHA